MARPTGLCPSLGSSGGAGASPSAYGASNFSQSGNPTANQIAELRNIGVFNTTFGDFDPDEDCIPLNAATLSAVSMEDYSGSAEGGGAGSCPPCDEQNPQSKNEGIQDLANQESNTTVYDVEDLNEASPPRNMSLDIPRGRLWHLISSFVEDLETEELEEYEDFLEEFQRVRRENLESTRMSQMQ